MTHEHLPSLAGKRDEYSTEYQDHKGFVIYRQQKQDTQRQSMACLGSKPGRHNSVLLTWWIVNYLPFFQSFSQIATWWQTQKNWEFTCCREYCTGTRFQKRKTKVIHHPVMVSAKRKHCNLFFFSGYDFLCFPPDDVNHNWSYQPHISVLPTSPWTYGPNYDCGRGPFTWQRNWYLFLLYDGFLSAWWSMPKDFEWLTLNPDDEQHGGDKLNSTKSKGAACKRDSEKTAYSSRAQKCCTMATSCKLTDRFSL